ncbi:MAG TPA: DUF2877 domain-containing protein [Geminicoccaceae bacterium]|nr:DUF2877 domain-containing protein [Geminicoccaceae bacterium]
MHLTALSAGFEAPRSRFNGVIHSVFDQACNIRVDDGRLLALLAPCLGNVPHGARIALPAGFGFARHLAVGGRVGCRADVLRLPGLSIDLGTAQPWRGDLAAAAVDLRVPQVARAWRTAWRMLEQHPRRGNTQLAALSRTVDRRAFRLARATRHLRLHEAARAIEALIGCGPGLTPSGDDLIVGFLAGLWSTAGDDPAQRAFRRTLCAAVATAAGATGDISRTYLTHATGGRFAEPLATLAARIADGAPVDEIGRASATALRVGHSSGSDGVLGLLLGLAAWSPPGGRQELEMPADG